MRKLLLWLFIGISVFLFAAQETLNLSDFKFFTYKVITEDGQEILAGFTSEKIKNSYEITHWSKFTVPEDEELSYDYFATSYLAALFTFVYNPAYMSFFGMIDVDNPTTLNMYGVKIAYEGEEKVGKYQGKKFTYYVNDKPLISWVINKNVPLVLKSIIHESGYTFELVDFQKR
ncbi:hypothetical protein ACSFC1_01555 [Pseudothermotoga sp. U03pept]|uniref:hypothetical protein n=1 Tax=Pseudothermotoga sp. U03pept TaxID=3447012 RepID=UPI003EFDA25E